MPVVRILKIMNKTLLLLLLLLLVNGCSQQINNTAEVWVFRHSIYTRETGGLTAKGKKLARTKALELTSEPFDAIYSSPVKRCRETAEIFKQVLGPTAEIVELEWLRDQPGFDGNLSQLPQGKRILVFTHSPNIVKTRQYYGMGAGGTDYSEGTRITIRRESEQVSARYRR